MLFYLYGTTGWSVVFYENVRFLGKWVVIGVQCGEAPKRINVGEIVDDEIVNSVFLRKSE